MVVGAHNLLEPSETQVTVAVAEVTSYENFYWETNSVIPVNDISLIRVS